MAGGAGRRVRHGAGDSECVKIVAQEIRQTDPTLRRRSPRSSGEGLGWGKRRHRSQSAPHQPPLRIKITIGQSIRLFGNQFVFHKGTKPRDIAGRRRIVSAIIATFHRLAYCAPFCAPSLRVPGSAGCASRVWSGWKRDRSFLLIT